MFRAIISLFLLASASVVHAEDPLETIGVWKITQSTDMMTDALEVTASVYSDTENAKLSFICSDAGRNNAPVRFMLTTAEFLGSSESYNGRNKREIMVRTNDDEPERLLWYYGDQSAFTLDMPQVSEFGNVLRRGDSLKMRALTYRGYQIDASFDVRGASGMIDRVKFLCRKNGK